MKQNVRFLPLLLLFVLLPVNIYSSSDKIVKDSMVSQNKKRTYYLFVPDNIKPSVQVPLIVLLHGSGRNGLSLVEKEQPVRSGPLCFCAGPHRPRVTRL